MMMSRVGVAIAAFQARWDLRASFLFVMSFGAIIRGWAYRPGIGPYEPPGALRLLPSWISLDYWAWAWIAVGAFGIVIAVTGFKHPEGARVAGFALMAMGSLWGLTYLGGWIASISTVHPNRDWFSGLILLTTAIGTAIGALMAIRLHLAYKEIEHLKAERVVSTGERAAMLREIEELQHRLGREQ